jgi:hypothetical protein
MAMPRQVSKKLREMLGDDAGGSMTDWLDAQERHHDDVRQEVHADIAELRQEMHTEVGALREELHATKAELHQEIVELRAEMRVGFARVDARFAETDAKIAALGDRTAQQLASAFKWAIGVWISSLAAVVGLMGLLRVLR